MIDKTGTGDFKILKANEGCVEQRHISITRWVHPVSPLKSGGKSYTANGCEGHTSWIYWPYYEKLLDEGERSSRTILGRRRERKNATLWFFLMEEIWYCGVLIIDQAFAWVWTVGSSDMLGTSLARRHFYLISLFVPSFLASLCSLTIFLKCSHAPLLYAQGVHKLLRLFNEAFV